MAIETNIPVTLISAGVGQTPMLAMLDTLAKANHSAQVNWFHAAENGDVHAFADEVKALGATLPRFTAHTGIACRRRQTALPHALTTKD